MLNKNIAEGKWTEIKGEILKMWGNLTSDELDQTKGDMTKVAGMIQTKYGETQEAVRNKLNSFVSKITPDNNDVKATHASTEKQGH